jgi:endonuclease III
MARLIHAFLEWETTSAQAQDAMRRLMEAMVDFNDVRVSLPHEVVQVIGADYPLALERASRMHDSLQEVYLREHATSLKSLAAKNKKDIRHYLDTLPGMPGFVAAQVSLQCFGVHAIPVDRLLTNLLREQQAVHPEATPDEIEAFLAKHVKQGDAEAVHSTLRCWVDAADDRASLLTKRQLDAARRANTKAQAPVEPQPKTQPKPESAPRKPVKPAKPAPSKKSTKPNPASKPAAKAPAPKKNTPSKK